MTAINNGYLILAESIVGDINLNRNANHILHVGFTDFVPKTPLALTENEK